jgi:hypothetical protein
MAVPQAPSLEDEVLHREMERFSLDWVMIYNPTDEDFYIEWAAKDGKPWKYLVPNKSKDIGWGPGKLEVQRYLAIWYCKHMKDKIVNDKGLKEGEKMLAARREKGQPDLTKFEEQNAIWAKTPKTSEKELSALYPILFLGVTREFGMEYTPSQGVDQTTQEEKVLDTLKNKKYEEIEKPKSKKDSVPLPSVEELEGMIKSEH